MIKSIYKKIFKLADKNIVKKCLKTNYKISKFVTDKVDFVYGKDIKRNRFDLYYPKNNNQKLPTILNVHGGGYVAGSKENEIEYCCKLAELGFCVINMEYTLSEQEGFPKPVYEVFDLFNYIENDKEISSHIDYDKFFLAGDSAGGHIVSSVANIQCNDEIKKRFGVEGGPEIKGLILNSPVFGAFRFGNLPFIKRDFEKIVFGKYVGSELQNYCHNLDILTDKFPPVIIFSASNDFIKIHANMFCKKAKELGLNVQSYTFVTGKHLGHDFVIYNLSDKEGIFALEKIKTFVNDVIDGNLKQGVFCEKINLSKVERLEKRNKKKKDKKKDNNKNLSEKSL